VKGQVLSASIVVHSEVLSALELTARLDMTPTETNDLGTMDESGRVREFTSWTLSSPLEPDAPLDEHLTWLLDTVAPANNRLRGLIATEQGSVRIEASVAHTDRHRMTFLSDVLQKLADFPGHFWLTAYAAESEE
jgi:hypothetical protein